ncbi:MAG: tRNA epoxyqueuosine(34) reductase QueG [Bdellovibrionales bacterium]|nr:tRNA epoxyqueuosine(34) reductase QueG [Bdellovibrionales bacterium]
MDFVSLLDRIMTGRPFSHYGWAAVERPLSMDVYRQWLERGHHADMQYLQTHSAAKENPRSHFHRAHSAIVVAKSYAPHPYGERPLKGLRTALYAQGEDYHLRFKDELESLAEALRREFSNEEFLCFTDSAPILERDLAYRAGLGWIGKNTCVIHPKQGSLFFLGQILTSLAPQTSPRTPVADACGTCDRCIRACPTGALEAPRWLNANKCISYWTIEARNDGPEEIRTRTGDWFFGCDICQTVCPWNEKHHGRDWMRQLAEGHAHSEELLLEDLRWILNSSGKQIEKALVHSPLLRARPAGLKRNALVVIGNRRLQALRGEVEQATTNPRLKDVARWALARLT